MNKNLLIDHTKLFKGQKLWDTRYGEVILFQIGNPVGIYPLTTIRENGTHDTFTLLGKVSHIHTYPSLYLSNPFEQVNEFPKLMEVTDHEHWKQRMVLCFDSKNKRYLAYSSEGNDTLVTWKYAREIQEPIITEYTIEEIAIKLGVDPNTIRIKK